jgi:hypothetical protein
MKLSDAANNACLTNGVVRAVLEDKYKKDAHVRQHIVSAFSQLPYPDSDSHYYRRLTEEVLTKERLEPVMEHLRRYAAMSPDVFLDPRNTEGDAQVQLHQQLVQDAINRGEADFAFRPGPHVLRCVRETAEAIETLMKATASWRSQKPDDLLRIVVGTNHHLDKYLHILEQQAVSPEHGSGVPFVSFVTRGLHQARQSIVSLLLRRNLLEDEQSAGFARMMTAFSKRNIQPAHMKLERETECCRFLADRVAASRADLLLAMSDIVIVDSIADIARRLDAQAETSDQERAPVYPWGYVMLIEPDARSEGRYTMYAVDGRRHMSKLGIQDDDVPAYDVTNRRLSERIDLIFRAGMTCTVTEDGQLLASEFAALAPVADDEVREDRSSADVPALIRADACFNGRLVDLWESYPELFALLPQVEPLIFFRRWDALVIVVHEAHASALRDALGREPVLLSDEQLASCQLISRRPMVAVDLPVESAHVEVVEPDAAPPVVLEERRRDRALIRRAFPRRAPSYQWLEGILRGLGVRTSSQGKGSHTSVHYVGRRDTISMDLRSTTESLPTGMLNSILERLGIGAEEFLQAAGVR